jgi:hypothetical protein
MMPNVKKYVLLTFILAITNIINAQDESHEFYELKIYSFELEEQEQSIDKFLKNAYLPALRKQNIRNIGVFKPRADSIKQIYVLIPFSSLEQFYQLENKLFVDKTYLANGGEYINAVYNKPAYQRIESILLKAFIDMPTMVASPLDGPRKERIYELRSYESSSEAYYKNKVDMFNAGGEVKLFERLSFNAVFYGEVISGSKMPNLMYMTTFSNQVSRDEHWKKFVDAPEWKELKSMSKYKNNVSHIDIMFLYPTDYSDY